MTIYRANDFIDAYRIRSMSPDINDLSGRDGRPDITAYVAERIALELDISPKDFIADIGCGDGTFLKLAIKQGVASEKLRGVLPTYEEVQRVNEYIKLEFPQLHPGMLIIGVSDSTSIPTGSVDKCLCNGVFLLLPDEATAKSSLIEFARITRKGGLLLIGEVPDVDEVRVFNPSQLQHVQHSPLYRAWRVLVSLGFSEVMRRLKRRLMSTFDRRIHLISPPTKFWMPPEDFEEMAKSAGFLLIRKQRSPSLSTAGDPTVYDYRWNYLFQRI